MDYLKEFEIFKNKKGSFSSSKIRKAEREGGVFKALFDDTSFLPEDASWKERLFAISNGITNRPVCKHCGGKILFDGEYLPWKYKTYCSSTCVSRDTRDIAAEFWKDPENVEAKNTKTRQTCIDRYGQDHFNKTEDGKQRMINGMNKIDREEVRRKREATCNEKFGFPCSLQNEEIRQKGIETNNQKYGVSYFNQQPHRQLAMQQLHLGKGANKKEIEEVFLKGGLDEVIKTFKISIGQANFLTRDIRGITPQTGKSVLEERVSEFIRSSFPELEVVINKRNILQPSRLELDIFIPSRNFAIEVNGTWFHSNTEKDYHKTKTDLAEKNNISLFHIFEHEWNSDVKQQIWKSKILIKLHHNSIRKLDARKLDVKVISNQQAMEFEDENHLQGSCSAKQSIGLFNNDELVSVMSFGKPRFNKKFDYELIRFCSLNGVVVRGGASKLLKFFRSQCEESASIITYANRMFSSGGMYLRLGMVPIGASSPGYIYWNPRTREFKTRYACQKHRLKGLLEEGFDENKTEVENMNNNGWRQIFDSGTLSFAISKQSIQ